MEFGSLWWVVVLTAVAIWIASAIVWMVLPHHASDFGKLDDEDAAMNGIGPGTAPGQYRLPHCTSMEAMKSEEFQAKQDKGPVGVLTIIPSGPVNMGKMLSTWFVYLLFTSFVVAYVARMSLAPGAECMAVFRLTFTVAFALYALQPLPDSIWMGKPWGTALKSVGDGLGYALITAGIFCWAWPDAA